MFDRVALNRRSHCGERCGTKGCAIDYARDQGRLPGRPDILFVGARVAVFVDGCFWHGCPEHGTQPKTRTEFWAAKIARNRERDEEVNAALVAMGWRVVRIWEHQLRRDLDGCVAQIKTLVKPRAGVEHR